MSHDRKGMTMRRLIASLVVGGMLLFGLAPAGADPGSNPADADCVGKQISVLVRATGSKGKILKETADALETTVGGVIGALRNGPGCP